MPNVAYDALNRLTYESFSDGTYRGGFAYDQATSSFGNTVTNPIGRLTTSWEAYGGKDCARSCARCPIRRATRPVPV